MNEESFESLVIRPEKAVKGQPLVSIVAICYNQAQYVTETLDSIVNQDYPNIQLIIIDDCSHDDSAKVIEEWINVNNVDCEFIKHSENLGVTKTCNDGLSRVSGKYYQILACDDILRKDKTTKQVEILEQDETISFVYSDVKIIDENGSELHDSYFSRFNDGKYPDGWIFPELIKKNFIPAMSVLVRTEYARAVGGYDESLWYEDWDMWLKLSYIYKVSFISEVLSSYRKIASSMMRSLSFASYETYFSILKKYFSDRDVRPVIRRNYEIAIHDFSTIRNIRELKLLLKFLYYSGFRLKGLKHFSEIFYRSIVKWAFNTGS